MQAEQFFGDQKYTFALTDDMVLELERLTNTGIGALYLRAVNMGFTLTDLTEIIRLGLIGGGASPENAKNLTTTYGTNRPISETYPLAMDILDARWGEPNEEAAQ
jgi:hypothetical protein